MNIMQIYISISYKFDHLFKERERLLPSVTTSRLSLNGQRLKIFERRRTRCSTVNGNSALWRGSDGLFER